MSKKIEKKNAVKRKPGLIYYVDKSGNLCSAKMKTVVKIPKKK